MARGFSAIALRRRQADRLDGWLAVAKASVLAGFAGGLAAVRAALALPWSTGPVEGQIGRLKTIKRTMCGREALEMADGCDTAMAGLNPFCSARADAARLGRCLPVPGPLRVRLRSPEHGRSFAECGRAQMEAVPNPPPARALNRRLGAAGQPDSCRRGARRRRPPYGAPLRSPGPALPYGLGVFERRKEVVSRLVLRARFDETAAHERGASLERGRRGAGKAPEGKRRSHRPRLRVGRGRPWPHRRSSSALGSLRGFRAVAFRPGHRDAARFPRVPTAAA